MSMYKFQICFFFFWVLKALYIWKGESPQQPPMCSLHLDDVMAAILHQNAHHTHQLTGGEKRVMKPISVYIYMGMIRRPWWTEANGQIWPGCPNTTPTLFLMARECQELGLISHPKDDALWQYRVPITILSRNMI